MRIFYLIAFITLLVSCEKENNEKNQKQLKALSYMNGTFALDESIERFPDTIKFKVNPSEVSYDDLNGKQVNVWVHGEVNRIYSTQTLDLVGDEYFSLDEDATKITFKRILFTKRISLAITGTYDFSITSEGMFLGGNYYRIVALNTKV